jgi:DNA-binding LacI/PurR family transcriptional regulator
MNNPSTISKPARRATLHDIARRAGVTAGTVSGVLKGKAKERRISDDVVERVRRAAAEMDYAPNLLVHSLRHGRTHIMSFYNGFRTRDQRDLYMDGLTTAIERAAGGIGFNTLICCDFSLDPESTYRYINGGTNDGLIFFKPPVDDPLLPFLRKSQLPIVLLNTEDETGVLSSVTDDWQSGIVQIADAFVSLGHKRIAALTTAGPSSDARDRVATLSGLLKERGIDLPARWTIPADAKQPAEVNAALRMLMAEPNPPTAIFCWHDYVGYVALEECDNLGISVPNDLSLVGYDGVRWPAKTKHTLASVHVNLDVMGETAVQTLHRLIDGERPPVRRTLPATLDHGTTLAPPRG